MLCPVLCCASAAGFVQGIGCVPQNQLAPVAPQKQPGLFQLLAPLPFILLGG